MDGQEQPGPSGRGAGGAEYTRGGVKKLKFAPNVPVRRRKAEPAAPGAAQEPAAGQEAFADLLAEADKQNQQVGRGRGRGLAGGRPVELGVGAPGASTPGSSRAGGPARLGSVAGPPGKIGAGVKGAVKASSSSKPGKLRGPGLSGAGGLNPIQEADSSEEEGETGALALDYEQFYPTTLPFHPHPPDVQAILDPFDELCTSGVPDDLATTEDAQDNVASRLCLEDLAAAEQQLYVFQLPCSLPVQRPAVKEEKPKQKHAAHPAQQQATQQQPAALAELPSGQLGKLLVFQSGAVKLRVGEVLFDVNVGMPCLVRQEVAALNHTSGALVHLGAVAQRAAVSPDVWQLLNPEAPREFERAEGCILPAHAGVGSPSKHRQPKHHKQQQHQQHEAEWGSDEDPMDVDDGADHAAPAAPRPGAPGPSRLAAAAAAAAAAQAAAGGGEGASAGPSAASSRPILPGLHGAAAGGSGLGMANGAGPSSVPGHLPSPGKPAGAARLDGLGSLPMAKNKLRHRPQVAPRKPPVKEEPK